MKRIIAVSGKMRSGKDTFFELLQRANSGEVTRAAFADAIKMEVSGMFGVSLDAINHDKDKFRPALIALGQLGRELNPNMWVDRTIHWIANARQAHERTVFVVTDCRFPNEVDRLKEAFGDSVVTVRVERDYTNRINAGANIAFDEDDTEISLDDYDFDYTIDNDGSMEDYYDKVWDLAASFFEVKC